MRPPARSSCALLLAAAFTGVLSPAYAQEPRDLTSLTPEELAKLTPLTESSASKYLNTITDSPASVSIVTAEEIRLYGYRTLADVLNSVRGISISNDRNYTFLGFRGISRPGDLNTRVLVLIDGHRLNDNVFDSVLAGDEFPVDLENVDRVEIIRGPGAALYGTSAFSAVISVVTKRGADVRGLDAMGSLGTLNTRRLRLGWGTTTGQGLHLFVSGSTGASRGQTGLYFPEFDAPETNNGIADRADQQRADHLAMNLEVGHVSVHSVYASRLKHIPTASFGTSFNDPRTRTFDGRGYVDVQYAREVGRRSDVVARIYGDHYRYDGWYIYGDGRDERTVNRDGALGGLVGGDVHVSYRLSTKHRVTAGTEYRWNLRQDQFNYDEPPSDAVYLDDQHRSRMWAVNLQEEFDINRRLHLHAGVRYESVPMGLAHLTPKFGAVAHLRAATTVKALFSRAIRSPSIYERFYQAPPNYVTNPSLSHEEITTGEVALEHAISPWANVSASLFANRVGDLIISEADEKGDIRFVNGLDLAAEGFELAFSSRSRAGVHVRASYAGLRNAQEHDQPWLGGAPRRLAKFNVGLPFERLRVITGLSLQVEGARSTHTGAILAPVAVTNWNIVRTLGTHAEIQAAIFNLFDTHYSEPVSADHRQGSIAQDGRQVAVKLLWRLR